MIKITLFIKLLTVIFVRLSFHRVIPTFSLTLTVGCELLAPCQSLQPTTSKQTVLWNLSKDIYVSPWQRKACPSLALMKIHCEKPVKYDQLWFSFLRKDILKECFLSITSVTNHKTEIRWNKAKFRGTPSPKNQDPCQFLRNIALNFLVRCFSKSLLLRWKLV